MAHEEPEQHQQAQRSGDDSQGSSPGGENISPRLAKELPFLLSSKMGTLRTANEKGHSASPRLRACPALLREQGVRNGFGFILVQAVESLQPFDQRMRALCQGQLSAPVPHISVERLRSLSRARELTPARVDFITQAVNLRLATLTELCPLPPSRSLRAHKAPRASPRSVEARLISHIPHTSSPVPYLAPVPCPK
jgi:hypothetical protein